VLVLPQELTQAQATACLALLVQGLRVETGPQVEVDAAALKRFDSAALAVLLEFRRNCITAGKRFKVLDLPARLGDLAMLYGVGGLLGTELVRDLL